MDVVSLDARGIGVDGQTRIVAPSSFANVESPCMPGAGNDPLGVHFTGAKRRPHVRAEIVDRVVGSASIKDGYQAVANRKTGPLALGYRTHFGNGYVIIHGVSFYRWSSASSRPGLGSSKIKCNRLARARKVGLVRFSTVVHIDPNSTGPSFGPNSRPHREFSPEQEHCDELALVRPACGDYPEACMPQSRSRLRLLNTRIV